MRKHLNPAFPPRVRFNWGYHDGAHDLQTGRCRTEVSKVPDGANPTRYLVVGYDPDYTKGYREGIQDARDGIYAGNSEAAWQRTQKRA